MQDTPEPHGHSSAFESASAGVYAHEEAMKGVSMNKVIGQLLCPVCSNDYEQPTVLRDAIGRDGVLWKLSCGHAVVKLSFQSAQEHIDLPEFEHVRGHIPVF